MSEDWKPLYELTNAEVAEYVFGSLPPKYSRYRANFEAEEFIDGKFLQAYQNDLLDDDLLQNDLGIRSRLARIAVKEKIRQLIEERKAKPKEVSYFASVMQFWEEETGNENKAPTAQSSTSSDRYVGDEFSEEHEETIGGHFVPLANDIPEESHEGEMENDSEKLASEHVHTFEYPEGSDFSQDLSETEPRTVDSEDFEPEPSWRPPTQSAIPDTRLQSLKYGKPRSQERIPDCDDGQLFEVLKTRIVRKTWDPKSTEVGGLSKGKIIQLVEEIGNRARVRAPIRGWITTSENGNIFVQHYKLDKNQKANQRKKRDPSTRAAALRPRLITVQEEIKMIKTLCKILRNLQKADPKYRVLHASNRMLYERVLRFDIGYEYIRVFGFRETLPGCLEVAKPITPEKHDELFQNLQSRLSRLIQPPEVT